MDFVLLIKIKVQKSIFTTLLFRVRKKGNIGKHTCVSSRVQKEFKKLKPKINEIKISMEDKWEQAGQKGGMGPG